MNHGVHLLFPASPLDARAPDTLVDEQYRAFRRAGFPASLISIEALQQQELRLTIRPSAGTTVLYRGWMLQPDEYHFLFDQLNNVGAAMLVSPEQYLAAHHLPRWYPLLKDHTPETLVLDTGDATVERLRNLGWTAFFIKDFVKSLKTSPGSRITDPTQLPEVLREMRHFRGQIEGGVCIRRVEEYEPSTETRYFAINGIPFGPSRGAPIPSVVQQAASRIASPFISIDIARRQDGVLRVVEVGDGQVSDLTGWSSDRFVSLWQP